MASFGLVAPPVDPTAGAAVATAADLAKRGEIKKTAEAFEASFLSVMLGEMFRGVDEGEFGGGEGARMFRSFLTEAMSKQMARGGGVGLAASVQAEMLKLQGLT